MSDTDRIVKTVVLRASRARVWRAISDAAEFGAWFGVALEGPFSAGTTIRGRITTAGYEHLTMEVMVERIEPERYLAFRWHPYAVDPGIDYTAQPTTLVEFTIDDTSGATVLTITESGFDRLPPERRDEAFRSNDGGWTIQAGNIERHVAAS